MRRNRNRWRSLPPLLAGLLLVLAAGQAARAQEQVKSGEASKKYDVTVRPGECGASKRGGEDAGEDSVPARVQIFRKGAKSPFQVLCMPSVWVNSEQFAYSPETAARQRVLYDDEFSVVFDDFNFDGLEDLAVCNGRNGGYGGPSYTVFLFARRAGRFVESPALSRLNEGVYLGLFFPDAKAKTLTALSKSGCCYHETEVYKVVGDRPVLVEKVIEDATLGSGAPEGYLLVTTRKRVGSRWVVTKKREKLERDTPDQE